MCSVIYILALASGAEIIYGFTLHPRKYISKGWSSGGYKVPGPFCLVKVTLKNALLQDWL